MGQVISHDRAVEEGLDPSAALDAERHLLERLVEELLGAFGAPVAGFFIRDGDRIRAQAIGGASAPVREAWADLPATGARLPIVAAAESGDIVLASTDAELVARFPAVADLPARTGLPGAAAFVPMTTADRTLGVLVLRFADERWFTDGELGFLRSFAHHGALALARIESLRIAQAATAQARTAADRADFLARAAERLIRSLDDRSTLQEVADLAVPAIADWCFVNVLDDAGRVVETASAHRDTGRHHDGSATLVLHTQQPVLIEEVTDERRATDAVDDDQRAFLRAFAARSAILVPLISHGRAFGSVTFLTAESERRFDQDDLTLAVELARRAATAIENDRLYADLRRARERAESLARASDLLAQGTDRETPLALLAELAVVSFADWCFVNVPDPDGTLRCVVAAARTPEDRAVAERSLGRAVVDPAFSEGRTILWEQLTDADLAAFAAGDAGAPIDYLRELSPGSAIAVPVRGRGGILGSLSLIARTDRPGYGPADIDHAEQLAWRTALALENAALYEDLRRLATTEQARAGELAAVIQAVGDPMVVCDRDGRVRLANQAARVAFDGEIPATFGGIRARFDDPEQLDSLRELGAGERGGPVELRLRGTDRWLELTTYPVPATFGATEDGRALGSSILVLRDVTAIRRALELREAFIGVLSHELRTPITTIYGGTRVLAREGVSEDTRREIAADVTAEAERLHRLVEDLLVLARAERETMDLGGDPVLLQHLVPRVLRTEEQRWPETTFRLSLPASLTAVSGDETYVEQVVRNLVGNAAKYGGATGIVEVAVEPYEDEVVVRVLDEGPGFATNESERLFELFYRSAKTSATTSGAGIGLFVCRALVEAMGGRIWAHPRPAGGAEFGFALPVFSEDD